MFRQQTISPYLPGTTEKLTEEAAFTSTDIGKAVVINGDYCDQAQEGDEIYGFIQSVEPFKVPGTDSRVATVLSLVNHEAYATDETGGLSVGDLVVSGTATNLGTAISTGSKVQSGTPTKHKWIVIGITTGLAGSQVLLRKI